MTADKLSVRVNYILDSQNNGKFNFDTSILKKFENEIKTTKDIGKYFKNKKKLPVLSSLNTKTS